MKTDQNRASISRAARDGPAPPPARQAIRIPKTAEIVAGQIRKMIIRGEVKEGDYLQPEGQLVEHFGTSRPTVREAFRILENEQLISVVRGSRSGARVHAPSVANVARIAGLALQAQGTMLSDVYLVRAGIEPFAARLAAERATPEQTAAFSAEIDRTASMVDEFAPTPEFRLAIVRLHEKMVAMAGSNSLSIIWALIQGIVEQHMVRYRLQNPGETAEDSLRRGRVGLRSFRKLLSLIQAGDAAGAEAHWRAHMENANHVWLAGDQATALVDMLD